MQLDLASFSIPADATAYQGSRLGFPLASISEPPVPTQHCTVGEPPSPEAVRAQLKRLGDSAFANSKKLFSFLHFVVAETIDGRGHTLKELVIGDTLYGGVQPYDPRIDSTVRVEARRLRKKLDAYYAGSGINDEVVISVPLGSYAPRLAAGRSRRSGISLPASDRDEGSAPKTCVGLAVLPFRTLSGEQDEAVFADGVTDELIFAAAQLPHLCVAPRALVFQCRGRSSLVEIAADTGADLVLNGTIRHSGDMHRVSVELTDTKGRVLWSDRVDVTGDRDFAGQEAAAAAVLCMLPATLSILARAPIQSASNREIN